MTPKDSKIYMALVYYMMGQNMLPFNSIIHSGHFTIYAPGCYS